MKFAVKRLRRSDLTFFEYQFRRQNAGNQKSINLNRDVFIDALFPSAPGIAARNGSAGDPAPFHLRLTIYGPGLRRMPQVVTRSVLPKTETQKNWRLNGEFVRDPDDDPARYHDLQPDDVAVLGFEGDAYPTAVTLVLLSQSEPDDRQLRADVLAAIGGKRMGAIDPVVLGTIIAGAPANHPIRELLDLNLDEALEGAALGTADDVRRVLASGSIRRMSARALQEARARAEAVGREGEVLLNDVMKGWTDRGRLQEANWIAEANAVNPWDFEVRLPSGELVRIEVKTTSGPFERAFHISQAEIECAADPAAPRTDLYRIFDLKDGVAQVRVIQDIRAFAAGILAVTNALGTGIEPDGFTVSPERVGSWSQAEPLVARQEEQDED